MRSSIDDIVPTDERDLLDKDAGRRFLDFYGDRGIRLALERYGIARALQRRGWSEIEIDTRVHDDRHTLLVSGRPVGTPEPARHRLVELVVRRDRLVPTELSLLPGPPGVYDVLTVDWLLLQNPLASFRPERPRLPGQHAPGLGIGERVLELLYRVVERLGLHALVTVAEHLHNAVLYARELPFFDPGHGGRLRALERMLLGQQGLTLAQASWAMHWGLVRGVDDAPVRWRGELQVRAFEPTLAAWLASEAHAQASARAASSARFFLDRVAFDERWDAERDALEGRRPES